uniref:Triggering receptor expressed on myeloid cells like 4 n=1 Tax=Pipistrellus kuhlii TaxID=59472 RepID=A0A7J7YPX0_PIPKU|nr:triggering receptor expressed on myeloid cells like 4 [Pipistrellus kuhlii]
MWRGRPSPCDASTFPREDPTGRKPGVGRHLQISVPALTPSPWTTAWPLESTVRITSPEGTSGPPSLNGSELRKSSAPLAPGWAASCILVAVLCGLFAAKGLVLAVLCVLLSCRRWAQGSRGLGGDSSDGEF